ncbi:hypothetical protein ASPSYDRAFT_557163 [Aspergillus sydowii CBS 593.65]|uniref:Uncharacterized protein n=1 Tax=Aspergillus sydowii CBS 593.65 TaxID=1036612 RepID=A0A1L9T1E5_9EURO|nr:uncharacterized protein ASPSYDRAFT_557163 [Aspergillus sydowii CBS 593.65]OJJ53256.1 hypothetical protein ASPSYDRAFT_557163 [Aspergillus sydowii CBS 593.65]
MYPARRTARNEYCLGVKILVAVKGEAVEGRRVSDQRSKYRYIPASLPIFICAGESRNRTFAGVSVLPEQIKVRVSRLRVPIVIWCVARQRHFRLSLMNGATPSLVSQLGEAGKYCVWSAGGAGALGGFVDGVRSAIHGSFRARPSIVSPLVRQCSAGRGSNTSQREPAVGG